MSGHCNMCGSLKIQETCYLCGSLKKRDSLTLEDGSGDGQPQLKKRETDSVQDCHLHGFSIVPVLPPALHSSLCCACSKVVNCPGLELSKPSSSPQHYPRSPQAAGINPNISPPSPSPAKGGSTPIRRCLSDVLPVTSPQRTGVISSTHGDMPTGSPVMTQESPDHERFKKMVERIKEMKELCETVVLEAEEGVESNHNNTTEGSNAETEEQVSMERDGEYIRIYLKCACSRAYQLLFSGSHCYYRLM